MSQQSHPKKLQLSMHNQCSELQDALSANFDEPSAEVLAKTLTLLQLLVTYVAWHHEN